MCELLGISAKRPIEARRYLREFYTHSVRHPHGWGLMREKNGLAEIIKEPECASRSAIIDDIINGTEPQKILLAHIRLATVGGMSVDNCHPYTGVDNSGRRWILIHNGTIYSGNKLSKYLETQKGDTDSERIFMYLIDEINNAIKENGGAISWEQRCAVLDKIVTELSPRNKLNLLIYDGGFLYAHKNMRETLFYKQDSDGIVISTTPLDNEEWTKVPKTRLLAFRDGEQVFEGKDHGNIFIPTLEYITALDAMNI